MTNEGDSAPATAQGLLMEPDLSIREVERRYTLFTMARFDHCRTQAAQSLGITRKCLYDRYRAWGIEMPPPARRPPPRRPRRELAGLIQPRLTPEQVIAALDRAHAAGGESR